MSTNGMTAIVQVAGSDRLSRRRLAPIGEGKESGDEYDANQPAQFETRRDDWVGLAAIARAIVVVMPGVTVGISRMPFLGIVSMTSGVLRRVAERPAQFGYAWVRTSSVTSAPGQTASSRSFRATTSPSADAGTPVRPWTWA